MLGTAEGAARAQVLVLRTPGIGRCGRSRDQNVLTDGAFYRELGTDCYTLRKPAKAKARAVSQLEALLYTVTLTPLAHTA